MTLTEIRVQKRTKDKLRKISKESESWDALLNRLYENEISIQNAQMFLGSDTLSLSDALEEIEKGRE